MHMVWKCEKVCEFWEKITSVLSDMIGKDIPVQLAVLLLNDDSNLGFTQLQRKICLAGLTSAKKIIAKMAPSQYFICATLAMSVS